MDIEEVKNRIKERGYWKINFYPSKFIPNLIPSREDCIEILTNNIVRLRGWSYPHIPSCSADYKDIYPGDDYYEAYIDWDIHKEVWRFYQSGQFIHYRALEEDWMQESAFGYNYIKPGSILEVIMTIYTLTEIFEFLRRLAVGSNVYEEGGIIKIELISMNGRMLKLLDPMRSSLSMSYIARIPEIKIPEKIVTKEDIINKSGELALEFLAYVFETFGWINQPTEVFKSDQQKLLERKF
jgi:hypothetical protein